MSGDRDTDDVLIRASARGDTEAFGRLVARYQQRVRLLAVALAGEADGDDVAQDSFVRAYRSLGSFRVGSPFEPWLRRIVVHQARNHHRGAVRRSAREGAGAVAQAGLERSGPTYSNTPQSNPPQATLDQHEQRRAIERALDTMAERDRTVLVLRFLLDHSEGETADMLGWPRGTVKSRTSRALARLRALLEGGSADV